MEAYGLSVRATTELASMRDVGGVLYFTHRHSYDCYSKEFARTSPLPKTYLTDRGLASGSTLHPPRLLVSFYSIVVKT